MQRKLDEQFVIGAHKVSQINEILHHCHIHLFSDIPPSLVALTGFQPVADVQEAVTALASQDSVTVGIMPHGALTFRP